MSFSERGKILSFAACWNTKPFVRPDPSFKGRKKRMLSRIKPRKIGSLIPREKNMEEGGRKMGREMSPLAQLFLCSPACE